MARYFRLSVVTTIAGIVVLVLLTNTVVFAARQRAGEVAIVATIRPQRIIVVDDDLTIQRIVSNTDQEVRPLVVRGIESGVEIPYSPSIVAQYEILSESIDFSQPGLVYERPPGALMEFMNRSVGFIRKWTFL